MKDLSTSVAQTIYEVLTDVSVDTSIRTFKTRYLLNSEFDKLQGEDFERIVDSSLLRESVAKTLDKFRSYKGPVVLLMDRKGGGQGSKVAADIITLLGKYPRSILIYVPFVTPPHGVGTLIQSSLSRTGADYGVLVDVVSANIPAKGLHFTREQAERLVEKVDIVITYAPEGSAGLIPFEEMKIDNLIAVSHINVLSYPDADYVVADLPRYEQIISKRPGFNHIEFSVEVVNDGKIEQLGRCLLGKGGDAADRLWVLMDNARRQEYRVLAVPVAHNEFIDDPLFCPCETLLKKHIGQSIKVDKLVNGGNSLVVSGKGIRCKK